ncbi:MAG: 3-hydroxyacyl-CoA dehydrogenase family protein [bacterium]
MTIKLRILISRDHHFFPILENSARTDVSILAQASDIEKLSLDEDLILDLTSWGRQKKSELLERLCDRTTKPVVSDLTLVWGEAFLKRYSFLIGAVATVFHSPTATYEAWIRPEHKTSLDQAFETLGISVQSTNEVGIGFTFPRISAMVINEAYFALEEGLASAEDIDTAMKFGVNYPLGPIDWAARTGSQHIATLLDELYEVTGDPRYRCAPALKLEHPSFD